VCWHRRYGLGDQHDFSSPDDFNKDSKDYAIVLPLYLYDHSGITISTTPFSCRWDSGQVGWIYATKESVRKTYGVKGITAKVRERARQCLLAEVEEYDKYIRGDVYGFVLEKREHCEECDHVEWEHEDSCWGFYGTDWDSNGLLEHIGEDNAKTVRAML
jgi:hypothetical protein